MPTTAPTSDATDGHDAMGAPLEARLRAILAALDAAFVEREPHARLTLLALLAGQHVLLLGPPGTGKSLLARAVCEAFVGRPGRDALGVERPVADGGRAVRYFEYLLTRFSHPDELFGPVSIPGLKEEDYRRLTDGFLPTAEVAFIDEIFKANSAILNSLLAIVNERVFHHGRHRDDVPLLGLIGASNEPPDPEGGLGALWDRFLVRLTVPPIEAADGFARVALGEVGPVDVPAALRLDVAEVMAIRAGARAVVVPDALRRELGALREALREAGVAASDRRWRWAVDVLRVAAFTAGRVAVGPAEWLLLEHCFGEPGEDAGAVRSAVRRSLEALVEPPARRGLEAAWKALASVPGPDFEGGIAKAYALRRAALDAFDAQLGLAERALDAGRDEVMAAAAGSPWLHEVPARLLAGFIASRRELERFRSAARRHRAELAGVDLRGELIARLRRAQAGGGHDRRGVEIALWLVPPDAAPEAWVPLADNGVLLFEQAPLAAGRVQRRLMDKALEEGRPVDGDVDWWRHVPKTELDEALVHALLSPPAELQAALGARGFPAATSEAQALRALSEWLRAAGVPRLPPLPALDG